MPARTPLIDRMPDTAAAGPRLLDKAGSGRYDRFMELRKGRHRPRVGRLPYLLATPFTGMWDNAEHFELITAPPRQLAHLIRHDELDAACVPIIDARSVSRRYEPLGTLGFATRGDAPVALFASRIDADLIGKAAIGASDQGATAVTALEILLTRAYNVERPNIVPLTPDWLDLGGFLVVGDDAISEERRERGPFVHRYNVATEWRRWTSAPLPLGRWIVRKTLPDEVKEELEQTIRASVAGALQEPGPLVAAHIDEHDLACTPGEVCTWLQACTFELGAAEERAAEHLIKIHREMNRKVTSWRDLL